MAKFLNKRDIEIILNDDIPDLHNPSDIDCESDYESEVTLGPESLDVFDSVFDNEVLKLTEEYDDSTVSHDTDSHSETTANPTVSTGQDKGPEPGPSYVNQARRACTGKTHSILFTVLKQSVVLWYNNI